MQSTDRFFREEFVRNFTPFLWDVLRPNELQLRRNLLHFKIVRCITLMYILTYLLGLYWPFHFLIFFLLVFSVDMANNYDILEANVEFCLFDCCVAPGRVFERHFEFKIKINKLENLSLRVKFSGQKAELYQTDGQRSRWIFLLQFDLTFGFYVSNCKTWKKRWQDKSSNAADRIFEQFSRSPHPLPGLVCNSLFRHEKMILLSQGHWLFRYQNPDRSTGFQKPTFLAKSWSNFSSINGTPTSSCKALVAPMCRGAIKSSRNAVAKNWSDASFVQVSSSDRSSPDNSPLDNSKANFF